MAKSKEKANDNKDNKGKDEAKGKKKKTEEVDVEKKFQKKSHIEHILLRPDTYIGSANEETEKLWIYDEIEKKLLFKEISYVPGLFKIFDEILVNAADHYENNKKEMNFIKVTIDRESNLFTIMNNGPGIPVKIHKEYGVYVPELIFGHLLTSTHYDDTQKRTTGGRNGYGAKLTNIFSKEFTVETLDSAEKKYYKQVFKHNMSTKLEPIIKDVDSKKESFTKISFIPDLAKFKLSSINDNFYSLLVKRVYDLAGVTSKNLKVYLNEEKIEIKDFKAYVQMYLDSVSTGDSSEDDEQSETASQTSQNSNNKKKGKSKFLKFVYCSPDPRWEVAMAISDYHFTQISFVNAICTTKGGSHVNYFTEKITEYLIAQIEKKDKKLSVKPAQIKNHLWVFVNCRIENPTFDGQTKDTLTLKASQFGSSFELEESYLKKILQTGILEECISSAQNKEKMKVMRALNQGIGKTKRVLGVPKLEDANNAGTKKSHMCTLILTEGDSAKSLAMAGIEVVGRDNYGVFPLKGKLLNVRHANNNKILKNEEIQSIMKIVGLNVGKNYEDVTALRYGCIMIMTDQDHDGSHIKGLIINFVQHFWNTLFQMDGFLKEFITPIIKMSKGKRVESFYTLTDYKDFIENSLNGNTKGWKIKYYKGLGTSTDKEAKEYFRSIDKNKIAFEYLDNQDEEAIKLAFASEQSSERKRWLENFDPKNDFIESNIERLRYKDFVNKELIHFSISDNHRSIPSLCDGLKPSERKVLFACFKRKLKEEIKVAQISGYIAEHSAYHHGEVSLQKTIIALAQNFVGSNNINLLIPSGQFGSRAMGGKDHASARYIFTNLNKITRKLFHENDDCLMNYLVEENQSIEPDWYLPILPLILINGSEGIGTGWSSYIPCFSPRQLAENFIDKINGKDFKELAPFYKGFQGEVVKIEEYSYNLYGKFFWNNDGCLEITELPIGVWTRNYKIMLEKYMGVEHKGTASKEKIKKKEKVVNKKKKKDEDEGDDDDLLGNKKVPVIIEDFQEYHTNNRVHFVIKFIDNVVDSLKNDDKLLINTMKLKNKKSISNMVLFDGEGKLRKYPNTVSIMEEFYQIRKKYYVLRKEYLLSILRRDLEVLSNKARFILAVIEDELIVKKRKKKEIINDLVNMKFTPMSKIKEILKQNASMKNKKDEIIIVEGEKSEESDNEDGSAQKVPAKEYNYLLDMPLWSLTIERVNAITEEKENKEKELNTLKNTNETSIWLADIKDFISALDKIEAEEEEERQIDDKLNKRENEKMKKNKKEKKKNKENSQEKDKKPKKIKENKEPKTNNKNKLKTIDEEDKDNKDKKVKEKKNLLFNDLTEEEIMKLPLMDRLNYKKSSKLIY